MLESMPDLRSYLTLIKTDPRSIGVGKYVECVDRYAGSKKVAATRQSV